MADSAFIAQQLGRPRESPQSFPNMLKPLSGNTAIPIRSGPHVYTPGLTSSQEQSFQHFQQDSHMRDVTSDFEALQNQRHRQATNFVSKSSNALGAASVRAVVGDASQTSGGWEAYMPSSRPTPNHHNTSAHSNPNNISTVSSTQYPQSSAGTHAPSIQHLLKQIAFLHGELERVEKELADTRTENAEKMRRMFERGGMSETSAPHSASSVYGPAAAARRLAERGNEALSSELHQAREACIQLERKLAVAIAEKSAMSGEKCDLLGKVKKLETALKEKQQVLAEAHESMEEGSSSSEEKLRKLNLRLNETTKEYAALKRRFDAVAEELAAKNTKGSAITVESFVQCDLSLSETIKEFAVEGTMTEMPLLVDAECQVQTVKSNMGLIVAVRTGLEDVLGQEKEFSGGESELRESYNSITHMLQVRCSELDTARNDFARLSEAQKETLQYLEITKKRLTAELNNREVLESDVERLSLQTRAQQQKTAQLSVQLRDKDAAIEDLQRQTQEAVSSCLRMERERAQWEQELATNAKDMQNLVTNQNFVHQQLSAVNRDNDELRAEIQRLLQLESTNRMSMKAKDAELGEVLHAYQRAVSEGEENINHYRVLEKEADNLRAALSAKEERLVYLMEQLAQLHAREQQLTIDLQSFDHDRGQLHRKLNKQDALIAQQNAHIQSQQQNFSSSQLATQQLERNAAELSKQLAIRDHECLNLRTRCDELEQEFIALQASHNAQCDRLNELEDRNAQHAVKEMLTSRQERNREELLSDQLRQELEKANATIRKYSDGNNLLNKRIDDERHHKRELEALLDVERQRAEEAVREQQRLSRLLEQNAADLSRLGAH